MGVILAVWAVTSFPPRSRCDCGEVSFSVLVHRGHRQARLIVVSPRGEAPVGLMAVSLASSPGQELLSHETL